MARMREEGAAHEIEGVGKSMRDKMPWIDQEF
jgi:ketol-acid reductoisomerase